MQEGFSSAGARSRDQDNGQPLRIWVRLLSIPDEHARMQIHDVSSKFVIALTNKRAECAPFRRHSRLGYA
jgi:hypothetical protein